MDKSEAKKTEPAWAPLCTTIKLQFDALSLASDNENYFFLAAGALFAGAGFTGAFGSVINGLDSSIEMLSAATGGVLPLSAEFNSRSRIASTFG